MSPVQKSQLTREECRAILRKHIVAQHDQWVFEATRQRQLKAQTAAKTPRKPK